MSWYIAEEPFSKEEHGREESEELILYEAATMEEMNLPQWLFYIGMPSTFAFIHKKGGKYYTIFLTH